MTPNTGTHMNRLYWKIFLSFWLVIIASVGITFLSNRAFFEPGMSEGQDRFSAGGPFVVTEGGVDVHRPPPGRPRLGLVQILGRLLIPLLVSGLVCFLLARYLTRPILQLRTAGQRIAGGDLSARAGPAFKTRSDELGDLGRDFDHMAERVEQFVTTQQRMLRDVSHELRSPLARLQAAIGLARQQAGSGPVDALDRADLETERLDELIEQILSFARLQSADNIDEQLTDIDDLLATIANDAQFEALSSERRVVYEGCGKTLAYVDSALLASAFENIVRNGLRYTATGTVVLIKAWRTDVMNIEISDCGPGVPDAGLPHLFEPFYRVDESRGASSGGSGVGLAIAERAIRLHGGSIAARNRRSGGLVVSIQIPLNERRKEKGYIE
jgi:two-component system sensor histidine kinase CpxA